MKKFSLIFAMIVALGFSLSGCGGAKVSPKIENAFSEHAAVYTQRNMRYNVSRGKNIVEATNYQIGILIPVNSKVTLESIDTKQIIFDYNGLKIILRNIPKYTGIGIAKLYARYFASQKVNLDKFTSLERKAIESAQAMKGISKEALLVALGYPPAHTTPSLKMNEWKYWQSRWSTFVVKFKDDKVEQIVMPNEQRRVLRFGF